MILQNWAEKPPLGTPLRCDAHWSVSGLIECWLLNEGRGLSALGIHSLTLSADCFSNVGLSFSGNSAYRGSFTPNTATSEYTIFTVATQIPIAVIRSLVDQDGTNRIFQYRLTASHNPEFIVFNTSGTAFTVTHPHSLPLTQTVFSMAATVKGNQITVYHNGIAATLTTTGVIRSLDTVNIATIGCRVNGLTQPYYGSLICCYIYNRALSAQEIGELTVNPWQVCQPRVLWWGDMTMAATPFIYYDLTRSMRGIGRGIF